jgi:very-short-patch-repair endonuclease
MAVISRVIVSLSGLCHRVSNQDDSIKTVVLALRSWFLILFFIIINGKQQTGNGNTHFPLINPYFL